MSDFMLCSQCQGVFTGDYPPNTPDGKEHHFSTSGIHSAADHGCVICSSLLGRIDLGRAVQPVSDYSTKYSIDSCEFENSNEGRAGGERYEGCLELCLMLENREGWGRKFFYLIPKDGEPGVDGVFLGTMKSLIRFQLFAGWRSTAR
ncbi:hypothetical protein ONS96_004662 [Cadophora gregata f. sp. sojae]|nr:hypothetical protein ONS96_004662 [Cadophora gregata f. sp. sojae]